MADFYIAKFIGGPRNGIKMYPKAITTWPLSNEIAADGGVYVKVSESELPEGADDHPNVSRGAAYEWKAVEQL